MNRCPYALLALLALVPLAHASDEVPLADLARHAQFRDIKISPQLATAHWIAGIGVAPGTLRGRM